LALNQTVMYAFCFEPMKVAYNLLIAFTYLNNPHTESYKNKLM